MITFDALSTSLFYIVSWEKNIIVCEEHIVQEMYRGEQEYHLEEKKVRWYWIELIQVKEKEETMYHFYIKYILD
jgi:hypothetical protein